MIEKKKCFKMLVGIPGSGKSTYIQKFMRTQDMEEWVIISSDNYIEARARADGITYNEAFPKYVGAADKDMYIMVKQAVNSGKNIIWDQTNLTPKTRAKKMKYVPDDYLKMAIVFPEPEDLEERLGSRPGKTVPAQVMKSMMDSFEMPTEDEGFDYVISS